MWIVGWKGVWMVKLISMYEYEGDIKEGRDFLFNVAVNTFYLRLYGKGPLN